MRTEDLLRFEAERREFERAFAGARLEFVVPLNALRVLRDGDSCLGEQMGDPAPRAHRGPQVSATRGV